ncbi:MAG TPA: restriction endonuclease subunit S [Solirubrobacterales bacterium]|nr:restriction endonuclease subunit S [Solirubrobacterales bacterium]
MTRWRRVRLDSCCEIVSGATPKTSVEGYWNGLIPWATPKDLGDLKSREIAETPRKLTPEGMRSCSARILPPGSVLFSSRAPIGHVAINTVPMATNQGFKSFVPDPEQIVAEYLYWWLRAHRSYLSGLGNGATFKELSKAAVARIEIPLPPLVEQRRVARRLDLADDLHRRRSAAQSKLSVLAGALFHERFGDPLDNPGRYPTRALMELVDPRRPITYGILKPGPSLPDGVSYVRVLDMKESGIDTAALRRTSPEISREHRRSLLAPHDLLLSIRGHVGRLASVPPALDGANITQDTARLAIIGALPVFVRECLRTPSIQAWMARRTKGVAVRGINLADVKKLPVIVPPEADQRSFVDCVMALDHLRQAHSRALAQVDHLFASIQYNAFYGTPAEENASEISPAPPGVDLLSK